MTTPQAPDPAQTRRPSRRYYSSHRMRNHQEAHADATAAQVLPVLDHPLVPAGEPAVVTQPDELASLIEELRAAGQFAYDSEFIGEQSYYPKLCLIQVATSQRVVLVDPLTGLDLSGFWALLADPTVEKLVHAGQQDLEPVARHLGQPAQRVFDTQVAAGFIGLPYPRGLAKLVEDLLGTDLSQGPKFSQWDRRPLSRVQLQYAANDVRYLPLLRQAIGDRLEAAGNSAWAEQECALQSQASLHEHGQPTRRVRGRSVEMMSPRRRAVLAALTTWREDEARRQDVPPRTLVKDGVLLELARSPRVPLEELPQVRGLPRPVAQSAGEAIVAALRAGLRAPLPPGETYPPPDPDDYPELVEARWLAVQARCQERQIDPAVVTSKREVARLVAAVAAGEPAPDSRLKHGWRGELLGDVLEF